MAEDNQPDITTLTVQLLSAFVSNNSVTSESLAELIQTTRAALTSDVTRAAAEPEAPTFTPAVSIRKSLSSPDHILSLIDGKPYKTLKRHLASHGLTTAEYRERYGLPASYPMVAPSYSDARRAVASKIGLGRKPATPAATSNAAAAKPAVSAPKKAASKPKPAAPAKAAKPAAVVTAPEKAAPARKEPARKKLSIAAPKPAKEAEAKPKTDPKPAAPKPAKKAAASGAKTSAKAAKAKAPKAPAVNGRASDDEPTS